MPRLYQYLQESIVSVRLTISHSIRKNGLVNGTSRSGYVPSKKKDLRSQKGITDQTTHSPETRQTAADNINSRQEQTHSRIDWYYQYDSKGNEIVRDFLRLIPKGIQVF